MVEVTGIPVIKVMRDPAKPHNTTITQRRTNLHERTRLAIHQTSCGISSACSRHFLNLNRGTYVESQRKPRSPTTKWSKHGRSTCQPHNLRTKATMHLAYKGVPITKDAPFSHGACQSKIGRRQIHSKQKKLDVLGCKRQQTFQRKPPCARNHSSISINIKSRMAAHLARKPPAFTYGTSRSMSRFNAPTCEASASKFTATRKRLLKTKVIKRNARSTLVLDLHCRLQHHWPTRDIPENRAAQP